MRRSQPWRSTLRSLHCSIWCSQRCCWSSGRTSADEASALVRPQRWVRAGTLPSTCRTRPVRPRRPDQLVLVGCCQPWPPRSLKRSPLRRYVRKAARSRNDCGSMSPAMPVTTGVSSPVHVVVHMRRFSCVSFCACDVAFGGAAVVTRTRAVVWCCRC